MKSLITIWILAGLSIVGIYLIIDYATMPAHAIDCGSYTAAQVCKGETMDSKYDGDCQPNATVGRCADKSPTTTNQPTTQVLGAQASAPAPSYVAPVEVSGFGGK